jgi:reactive intermediate/imine deaminase
MLEKNMSKIIEISTDKAPSAIGAYSQAIKVNNMIFISGQIPLNPKTMEIVPGNFDCQVDQVLDNIISIAMEAGCNANNVVKITVFLKNLENFQAVNKAMERAFSQPYPARAAVEVSRLPKDVEVEMDAILIGN